MYFEHRFASNAEWKSRKIVFIVVLFVTRTKYPVFAYISECVMCIVSLASKPILRYALKAVSFPEVSSRKKVYYSTTTSAELNCRLRDCCAGRRNARGPGRHKAVVFSKETRGGFVDDALAYCDLATSVKIGKVKSGSYHLVNSI